jgi:hypothetical protein
MSPFLSPQANWSPVLLLSGLILIVLQNRKPGETEREFLTRIALYEKCPGLIIDEEITRFNVCVECGVVTKNLSTNHRCQTKVRLFSNVADP